MGVSNGNRSFVEPFKTVNLNKGVKSSYIIKSIFSYLKESRKIKLVAFNKKYQNKFGIKIEDIKITSGKLKFAPWNGYGKEFCLKSGELIYEGEYLNGKRNGKGKEYENGEVIFEGKYSNGKRNGKGKEYHYNNKLKFEGEYLNGKRHGKGKEYDGYNIRYEGEYLNGERYGKGKTYSNGRMILNIEKDGKGEEYYNDGTLMFRGEFRNQKKIEWIYI